MNIADQHENDMKELIPTGTLRAGVAFAPAPSPLFVTKDAGGTPGGVTIDLAKALAAKLGVAVDFLVAPNTGQLTDALEAEKIDVSFMPVDDERRKRIDFGPAYFLVESTYMVTPQSGIVRVDEVDRAGVRVVGIANTTTIRAAGRSLKNTTIEAAPSIDEAMAMMKSGRADAFALSRDAFPPYVAQIAGARIVEGGFQQTGVAIAVPKGRPQALAYATAFLEAAKKDGTVRRAFDAAGLRELEVAP
jgi:polar amino acid transport system substrate-binding protein